MCSPSPNLTSLLSADLESWVLGLHAPLTLLVLFEKFVQKGGLATPGSGFVNHIQDVLRIFSLFPEGCELQAHIPVPEHCPSHIEIMQL